MREPESPKTAVAQGDGLRGSLTWRNRLAKAIVRIYLGAITVAAVCIVVGLVFFAPIGPSWIYRAASLAGFGLVFYGFMWAVDNEK